MAWNDVQMGVPPTSGPVRWSGQPASPQGLSHSVRDRAVVWGKWESIAQPRVLDLAPSELARSDRFAQRTAERRGAVYVLADLFGKRSASGQPPTQGLDETLVALPPLRLCRRLSVVGKRRRAGQPEADEERQRLVRDGDVPLQPFHLPRHAVQPPRDRKSTRLN